MRIGRRRLQAAAVAAAALVLARLVRYEIAEQSMLLNRVSDLIDQGYIQTTVGKNLGIINAENLKIAHEELESGRSIGKIVLEGF